MNALLSTRQKVIYLLRSWKRQGKITNNAERLTLSWSRSQLANTFEKNWQSRCRNHRRDALHRDVHNIYICSPNDSTKGLQSLLGDPPTLLRSLCPLSHSWSRQVNGISKILALLRWSFHHLCFWQGTHVTILNWIVQWFNKYVTVWNPKKRHCDLHIFAKENKCIFFTLYDSFSMNVVLNKLPTGGNLL